MTTDEMIEAVRAALAPGADDESRRRGAAILRGVLAVLEPPAPTASVVGASTPPGGAAPVAPAHQGPPPDLLTWLVDRLRPLVPPDALKTVPGLHIPMVDFGTRSREP
jgi:hypothetical protein